ncbi:MAG: hypothetical protein WC887_02675 [Candidatus Paceibacterota bacterium]|jgi:hypothetical protein
MNKTWYIAGILVIIILALFWYFSTKQALAPNVESTVAGQESLPPISNGNTTTDISNDLNQIPDTTAALDQAAASSVQEVQSL